MADAVAVTDGVVWAVIELETVAVTVAVPDGVCDPEDDMVPVLLTVSVVVIDAV